ncbi:MAG: hypothetical protein IJS93_01870 [Clostridia bacterium]|nr:hypothetical protein [Clostridia bacterium]
MQAELNSLKNIVIGFDPIASTVRVFRVNSSLNDAVCNDIKVDKNLFLRGEYGEALRNALSYYVKNIADIPSAFIVLPNSLVASDYVELPKMNKKKILESLRAEIVKLYANSMNLNVLTAQVDDKGEENALFFVTMGNMLFINDVSTGLAKVSVQPRAFTYSAPCSLNALLETRSNLRNKTFLFADVRAASTILTVCSNSTIRCYLDLPFGFNVLRTDIIYPENSLIDNGDAEETVDAAVVKASGGKKAKTYDKANYLEDYTLNESEREKKKLEFYDSLIPEGLKTKVTGEELDVLYANFALFEKNIDLFVESNSNSSYIPKIESVIINLPEEFYCLKDFVAESGKKIPYEFLDNKNKNRAYVLNFDLYGATLIRKFNTEQVF